MTVINKNFPAKNCHNYLLLIVLLSTVTCSPPKPADAIKIMQQEIADTVSSPANSPEDVVQMQCEITCPACGSKKTETMPTDICLLSYTCKNCGKEMYPKEDDCCVFCTYGNHKCPSMQ